ncbi:hypothetical protein CEE35_07940 [Candidatus Aerophobetes bacterium Ae_b3b]|nr:MAG: hypothetical protein CEE35_07940 [Candidatus Aerophobetes bacterium Ae_b3b]
MGMILFPFFINIWLSFQKKNIGMPAEFIGLGNYIYWLRNPDFFKVLKNTLVYTSVSITLKFVLGLGAALLLNRDFRGRNFFRGFLLIPWILPTVVTCFTWRWLYDDLVGVFNFFLVRINVGPVPWLSSSSLALGSVIAVNVWRGFPFFGILLLAGLQSVPGQSYEAAKIDGANTFQCFLYVTLPALRSIAMIAILLSTIWTFNDFEIVYLLTRGGPGYHSMIMVPFVYEIGIRGQHIGQAITFSVMVFPLLVGLILITSRIVLRER